MELGPRPWSPVSLLSWPYHLPVPLSAQPPWRCRGAFLRAHLLLLQLPRALRSVAARASSPALLALQLGRLCCSLRARPQVPVRALHYSHGAFLAATVVRCLAVSSALCPVAQLGLGSVPAAARVLIGVPSSPGRSFPARAVFPSSDSASHRYPIRVST
jgi:hypothetical protein